MSAETFTADERHMADQWLTTLILDDLLAELDRMWRRSSK